MQLLWNISVFSILWLSNFLRNESYCKYASWKVLYFLVMRDTEKYFKVFKIQCGPISPFESHSVVSNSLWLHGLYSPWHSPGLNTGVGSCSLLQGIVPTQGLNPGLPHCRQILYQPSHQKPKNTSSLSLLQWIFSTQDSNWDLLHCRWILYQLSYQSLYSPQII